MKNIYDFENIQEQTGLSSQNLEEIKSICLANPKIETIILFGSRAKGTWKKGSDVNLCLRGVELQFSDIVEISYKLNEETLMPYMFDVLLWEKIKNQEIAEHIKRCGIQLFN